VGTDKIKESDNTHSQQKPHKERPKKPTNSFSSTFDNLFSNLNFNTSFFTNSSFYNRTPTNNSRPLFYPTQPTPLPKKQRPVWNCPKILAKNTSDAAILIKNITKTAHEKKISVSGEYKSSKAKTQKRLCNMLQISTSSQLSDINTARKNAIKLIHPDKLSDELKETGTQAYKILNLLFDVIK